MGFYKFEFEFEFEIREPVDLPGPPYGSGLAFIDFPLSDKPIYTHTTAHTQTEATAPPAQCPVPSAQSSQVKCLIPISQRAAKAVRAKTLRVLVVFCGAAPPVFRQCPIKCPNP